jgi:uncharacterized SAM-binding protein YcdF (DUF218 family)
MEIFLSTAPVIGEHSRGAWLLRSVLACAGVVLCGDALWLMSMRLFNFGVLLPGLLGSIALLLAWRWHQILRWKNAAIWRKRLWLAGWLGFSVWIATLAGFFYGVDRDLRKPTAALPGADLIIVLGSGTPRCTASPTLAARLDRGVELAARWPSARVVVSGGQDFGLRCSEAEVMADYLRKKGVGAERIVLEDKSTSTEENLRFSARILAAQAISPDAPVALVTSDFHIRRAEWIARKAGFSRVSGVAAPTPLYLRYNAWLREYFAIISGFLLREYR